MTIEDAEEHSKALTEYLAQKHYRWFVTSFDGYSMAVNKEAMQQIIFHYLKGLDD